MNKSWSVRTYRKNRRFLDGFETMPKKMTAFHGFSYGRRESHDWRAVLAIVPADRKRGSKFSSPNREAAKTFSLLTPMQGSFTRSCVIVPHLQQMREIAAMRVIGPVKSGEGTSLGLAF
jgi:hypothetical protein